MGSISSCCNANDINPDEQRDKMKASKRKGSLETASGSATQSRGPGGQLRAFEAISQGHCSTRRLKRVESGCQDGLEREDKWPTDACAISRPWFLSRNTERH